MDMFAPSLSQFKQDAMGGDKMTSNVGKQPNGFTSKWLQPRIRSKRMNWEE